jgi:hypothetical protein
MAMAKAKIILEPGNQTAGRESRAGETLPFRQSQEIIGCLARLLVDVVNPFAVLPGLIPSLRSN